MTKVIDLSDSVAMHTVKFGRPVKGSDLIDAVSATCEHEFEFVKQHSYNDGHRYVVGRKSVNQAENLVVTPTKTDPYIYPDESYDSAVVVSHGLGGSRYEKHSPEEKIGQVLKFADGLQQQFPAGQQQEQAERSRDPYAPAAGAVASQPAASSPAAWRGVGSKTEPRGY
ncbi:hypothetical protein FB561_4086 [Kribbella amoyensis]|uniref:Uncharacterized protein n=1 Tax=Kribbella amoyensis TaxID=996641 RepID=A0A561BVK8_9ACTN|nr:hypothetical protein [Kribbella amoyensis]TWD82936.1 hypothetical protein FB561_4086 [Kribbella amoyensis]